MKACAFTKKLFERYLFEVVSKPDPLRDDVIPAGVGSGFETIFEG